MGSSKINSELLRGGVAKLQEIREFLYLYNNFIERKRTASKKERFDIHLEYKNSQFVIQVKRNDQIVFQDEIECSRQHGRMLANTICEDFIGNHFITLSGIEQGITCYFPHLRVQNTMFDVYYAIKSAEDKTDADKLQNIAMDKIKKQLEEKEKKDKDKDEIQKPAFQKNSLQNQIAKRRTYK